MVCHGMGGYDSPMVEGGLMSEVAQGQGIPGSHYYRDFCSRCGSAMRVSSDRLDEANYCEECSPSRPPAPHTNLTPRMRHGLRRTS